MSDWELNGISGDMSEVDFANKDYEMDHWRWCDQLTVVEASLLTVGLNPSEWEPSFRPTIGQGHFHKIGTSNNTSNYFDSKYFPPVFRAISRALLSGELDGAIQRVILFPNEKEYFDDLGSDAYSSAMDVMESQETLIQVDDFRRWMEAKGRKPAFFFPPSREDASPFKDSTHDHFSAELDLAVKVWMALESEQRFNRGPKYAIGTWIDNNPDAWVGESALSANAKDRVVTLVNWRKSGGAPASEG